MYRSQYSTASPHQSFKQWKRLTSNNYNPDSTTHSSTDTSKTSSATSTSKNKLSQKLALHPFGARSDANTYHSGSAASHKHHASEISALTIRARDIPLLIRAVLKLNYFMVGNTLILQQRGAPMGSPASPALCSMVVSVEEQAWYFTFQHLIHNHKTHQHLQQQHQHPHTLPFFSTRYVDNRVVILPLRATNLPCFRQLLDESFYRQPIQLEYEPANTFLGLMRIFPLPASVMLQHARAMMF